MISAKELKNGTTFLLGGKPYQVIKYTHTKIGRGGANVKVSVRNLQNGNLSEKTFVSSGKFDEITTKKSKMQFLYADADYATFMDERTYEQVEVPVVVLGDQLKFINDGDNVNVLFWDENALSVEIPPKVILEVTDTNPGVKGNSATNIYKPATLSNGLEVKVPLFIKKGDKVRVDTRTSEYVERVND
jgi:elongation factor P